MRLKILGFLTIMFVLAFVGFSDSTKAADEDAFGKHRVTADQSADVKSFDDVGVKSEISEHFSLILPKPTAFRFRFENEHEPERYESDFVAEIGHIPLRRNPMDGLKIRQNE